MATTNIRGNPHHRGQTRIQGHSGDNCVVKFCVGRDVDLEQTGYRVPIPHFCTRQSSQFHHNERCIALRRFPEQPSFSQQSSNTKVPVR